MQSDLFIIINICDSKSNSRKINNLDSPLNGLSRYKLKSLILGTIKEYIYKEKHTVAIDMLDSDGWYVYKHEIGSKYKSLIKTLILPKIEDALIGIDFIKLTNRGLNICLDGLLSTNTFMLQISFIENK